MVLKQVEATLNSLNIGRSEEVIVGLSGGADSVCLLHCLKKLGQNVSAIHVHHMIRGAEADGDAEFARSLCSRLNVPFCLEKVDVPAYASENKLTIEQAARELRYQALLGRSDGYVAVAHNLNDQAETVLMRLARGTGSDGICAMKEKNGRIIRPLLGTDRADIEAYCRENGLDFVTDSTNLRDCYSRNAIRLQVLPALERISPNAVCSIVRASELVSQDVDFIYSCIEKELWRITVDGNMAYLDVTGMDSLHYAISSRLLREAISRIDSPVDIEYSHINAMLDLIKGQKGREVSLPRGLSALYSGNLIVIGRREAKACQHEVKLALGELFLDGLNISVSKASDISDRRQNCEFLALDSLEGVVLRRRREGDVIHPYGASGSKSLKKYLIDKKIPLHKRDELVLVAKGSTVLAVIGYTVNNSVAVTDQGQTIYKIQIV